MKSSTYSFISRPLIKMQKVWSRWRAWIVSFIYPDYSIDENLLFPQFFINVTPQCAWLTSGLRIHRKYYCAIDKCRWEGNFCCVLNQVYIYFFLSFLSSQSSRDEARLKETKGAVDDGGREHIKCCPRIRTGAGLWYLFWLLKLQQPLCHLCQAWGSH